MAPRRAESLFRRMRRDRGANLVEFALVTAFLLLPLLVGVVDVGRAFYSYVTMTNAVREGAREASRFPFPMWEDAEQTVHNSVREEPSLSGDWTKLDVALSVYEAEDEDLVAPMPTEYRPKLGDTVVVGATLPFDLILGSLLPIGPINMHVEATMIVFGVDSSTETQ